MQEKIRLCVLFGGRSAEHEVSVISARSLIQSVDLDRYELLLVGIDRDGCWAKFDSENDLKSIAQVSIENQEILRLDYIDGGLIRGSEGTAYPVDVVFPMLHGPYGEDGSVQGLLELANIPYVGSGVAGSSVGMDKVIMKSVFEAEGLPQLEYCVVSRNDWQSDKTQIMELVLSKFGFPVFVKPANMGSSVGVSRVIDESQLTSAIDVASRFDRRVIIEKSAESFLEVEVAILGNDSPEASVAGEIELIGNVYDYEAKYLDNSTKLHIPARIDNQTSDELRKLAIRAFYAVNGSGLSRVDFFVQPDGNGIYLNEINTMPGFTPVSMYPLLWEKSGVTYSRLIDRLIDLAIERHNDKRMNQINL
ncbi:MAG: D-alanine--D-alanine ligase family protein [Candidatus Latescibacterota bacterium]|nr:D-alanine--D-alanine ligase family protein [Candidatus Latescibacterota bacterium]